MWDSLRPCTSFTYYVCVYVMLFSPHDCLQIFTWWLLCSILLIGKWEFAFKFIVLVEEKGNEEQIWKG